MAKAVSRTWFRVALARPDQSPPGSAATPAIIVASEGEHLGVAIAAAEQAFKGSFAIACDRAGDQIPLGESVGKQHVVELAEPSTDVAFRWPRGVLPKLGAGTDPATGYVIRPDPKLFVVEAQTTADRLVDVYLGVLERLPSADNLEIRVLDHGGGADHTSVWLTSRVDGKRIMSFLDDHDVELLENGHVELSIYIRAKHATLRLTEHKTVVWLSDGDELRGDVTRWMAELKLPAIDTLTTVAAGPHFHYRGAKTRDRVKLEEYLYRHRLRRVDKLGARGPETDG